MHCGMADESVVVIKFRPVKAGNSLEDKTGMTPHSSCSGVQEKPKAPALAKGGSLKEDYWRNDEIIRSGHNRSE